MTGSSGSAYAEYRYASTVDASVVNTNTAATTDKSKAATVAPIELLARKKDSIQLTMFDNNDLTEPPPYAPTLKK